MEIEIINSINNYIVNINDNIKFFDVNMGFVKFLLCNAKKQNNISKIMLHKLDDESIKLLEEVINNDELIEKI